MIFKDLRRSDNIKVGNEYAIHFTESHSIPANVDDLSTNELRGEGIVDINAILPVAVAPGIFEHGECTGRGITLVEVLFKVVELEGNIWNCSSK